MLATYAMARGWNDFWLAWIAVDLVGVPLLWHSGYYPSAILYVVYGGLVHRRLRRLAAGHRAPQPVSTDREKVPA